METKKAEVKAEVGAYEPIRRFRFIAEFGELEGFKIMYAKSLPGGQLEIGVHWTADQATPPYIDTAYGKGTIKLLDPRGVVVSVVDITYARCERLPFDLDYRSDESTLVRFLLSGVYYGFLKPDKSQDKANEPHEVDPEALHECLRPESN